MDYSETDLPVTLKETEEVVLSDGTSIRFEESSGAKDISINDESMPRATLFPGRAYKLTAGGKTFLIKALPVGISVEAA